jgi:hypothetical protein
MVAGGGGILLEEVEAEFESIKNGDDLAGPTILVRLLPDSTTSST